MSTKSHWRHDISDHVWDLLEAHLPDREGSWGGRAKDNRQFIMLCIETFIIIAYSMILLKHLC